MPELIDFWKLAAAVCTPKQLEILQLRERDGLTWEEISLVTRTHPSTVRGQHRAATFKIHRALNGDLR